VPAFLFPGQGSQQPGMGRPWVDHPSWELVADASKITGRDVAHLLIDAGDEELTETRNSQLSTFTLSMVVLDAVERLGIEPTGCAGHSVGEYAALVAAGVISFDDGVRVVAERGEAMQAAAEYEPGMMLAIIGLDADTVDAACRRADGDVWLANDNSPEDTVIAGEPESVERAGAIALQLGARKLMAVQVGGAFHTPAMAGARGRLRKSLREVTFRDPDVTVVSNVDALSHSSAEDWQSLLSAQLCSPVRWRQTILQLSGMAGDDRTAHNPNGEHMFCELGPAGSLSTMIRRSVPGITTVEVATPDDLDRLVDAVAGISALGALASGHQGEHLYVRERVVISPRAGVFEALADSAERCGQPIEVGAIVGSVSGQEVRSPFAGVLIGMLAQDGERVQPGQPVAWLRAE
jgi:[acyl-carrier-protein] S-malonyltransferase